MPVRLSYQKKSFGGLNVAFEQSVVHECSVVHVLTPTIFQRLVQKQTQKGMDLGQGAGDVH